MNGTGKPARHVDHDQLATSYDQRYTASRLTGVLAALHNLVEDVEARRILGVGYGTGRWLADAAYNAGIRRIKAAPASAQAAGETLSFATDILLRMMVGKKGS